MNLNEIISLSNTSAVSGFIMMSAAVLMKMLGKASKDTSRQLLAGFFFIPFFTFGNLSIYLLFESVGMPGRLFSGMTIVLLAVFITVLYIHGNATIKSIRRENVRLRNLENRLNNSSLYDVSTGAYNRQGFAALIKHYLLLAKRDKKPVLFFYATLNNLQNLIDSKGQQEGDLLLSETSKLLRDNFRKSDIIARIDRDTFIVLLVAAQAAHEDAITINFQKNLDALNQKRNPLHKLFLSFCIVPYDPSWNDEMENIMKQAKTFLAEKKNSNPVLVSTG